MRNKIERTTSLVPASGLDLVKQRDKQILWIPPASLGLDRPDLSSLRDCHNHRLLDKSLQVVSHCNPSHLYIYSTCTVFNDRLQVILRESPCAANRVWSLVIEDLCLLRRCANHANRYFLAFEVEAPRKLDHASCQLIVIQSPA